VKAFTRSELESAPQQRVNGCAVCFRKLLDLGKTGTRIPGRLVSQVRDLHVIRLQQLAGGMIEAGHRQLVVDLGLQQT